MTVEDHGRRVPARREQDRKCMVRPADRLLAKIRKRLQQDARATGAFLRDFFARREAAARRAREDSR